MRHLILFLVCLSASFCSAQNLNQWIQAFENYTISNPVEKIYLHLDKPYYIAGEYMYFRAYLTNADLNQEAVASNIIYVELSDERKEIVKRILLYSDKKEFAGQIQLPDSLPAANYHLRAYTNWMRNAGEDYFYHRDLYIGHPTDKKEIKTKPFDYEVAFFPEGGQLLVGLPNKVAFKALGNDGFGATVSGVLKNETGNEVLHFSSSHGGMGCFSFAPEEGKTYRATVTSNGIIKEVPLPLPNQGISLSLTQTQDSIRLLIRSTNPASESIRVIAQSRQTICYALTGQLREKEETITISKDKFPTGIAQFTLFKDDRPVSERLVFIDRNDNLRITITPDKEKYTDREKIQLAIEVADKDGNPVAGSFSLAVTDDKVVTPSINQHNIKGTLLLDSDLKGYIEAPGWYFAGDEPERKEALDNLLCTQGWTRYTWEKVINPEEKKYYPVESEFRISGKVTNLINKPIKDGEVILFGNGGTLAYVSTDKNGQFEFVDINCPDTSFYVLQGRDKRNKRLFLGVSVDKPDRQSALSYIPLTSRQRVQHFDDPIVNYTEQAVLQKKYINNIWDIMLPEIEVKSNKKLQQEHDELFQNMFSHKMKREELNEKILLRLELPRIIQRFFSKMNPPGMVVDGLLTNDISMYEEMPVIMFDIEIVRGPSAAIYGVTNPNGAVVINLRKPEEVMRLYSVDPPGLTTCKPEGYCIRKEFYVPAYDNPEVKQNPTPDLRTTIYWNPVVRTDKDGRASVSFYAADNVTTYSYVAEIVSSGKLGCHQ